MEYKINDFHSNTHEGDLLDDLKRTANKLGKNTLTLKEYDETGKFNSSTVYKRFGTWNKSLQKAGLESTLEINVSEKELFENIEEVWICIGRQPTRREMRQPLSKYSTSPYIRRFGSWRKALYAFVEFINSAEEITKADVKPPTKQSDPVLKHKTRRIPSERLKVQVLMRDGNTCRLCGVVVTGENIHFDHVLPWAKGGETILENIQVLCEHHNLTKGDLCPNG